MCFYRYKQRFKCVYCGSSGIDMPLDVLCVSTGIYNASSVFCGSSGIDMPLDVLCVSTGINNASSVCTVVLLV